MPHLRGAHGKTILGQGWAVEGGARPVGAPVARRNDHEVLRVACQKLVHLWRCRRRGMAGETVARDGVQD